MLPLETSLILIAIGFLMRIMRSLSMRLLVMVFQRYILPSYLVVKNFIHLNLILQIRKKMTLSKKWLKSGATVSQEIYLLRKQLSKLRSFTRHPLLRWLRLHSKLSWLSLSYGMSRIRLNTLRLLRSRLKWLSVILWESARRLEQWMDRH